MIVFYEIAFENRIKAWSASFNVAYSTVTAVKHVLEIEATDEIHDH